MLSYENIVSSNENSCSSSKDLTHGFATSPIRKKGRTNSNDLDLNQDFCQDHSKENILGEFNSNNHNNFDKNMVNLEIFE